MPGDNITMEVELITPVALEEGCRFAIREGGRTVGAGAVTKVQVVTLPAPFPPGRRGRTVRSGRRADWPRRAARAAPPLEW